jgi:hypothetical protein
VEPRTDIQREITRRIEAFVGEITELARRHALDTLSSALADRGGRSAPRPARRRGAAAEIRRETERLFSFIQNNPGQRMEEIARGVGVTTKDLALPVKKLLGDSKVTTEGQKRATRYFPSTNGEARGKRRGGRGKKR